MNYKNHAVEVFM